MTESEYIKKLTSDTEQTLFESLREEGIKLIQKMSGQIWTDYNIHDPGVTILEYLCYALTDLIYRTDFDVADYLTREDGTINFNSQALYLPEEILPNQPITINDYRKFIFDSLYGNHKYLLENVWVKKSERRGLKGLYHVNLKLMDDKECDKKDEIIKDVYKIYCENRNLCEDLSDVNIIKNDYCTLHGKVEISTARDPEAILADIYFNCSKYINPIIRYYSFDELLKEGKSLDEIFTGPSTRYGYIKEKELEEKRTIVKVYDIIQIINSVNGVESVVNLYLKKNGQIYSNDIEQTDLDSVLCLTPPDEVNEDYVQLIKNGTIQHISIEEVRAKYDNLYFKYRSIRHTKELFQPPKGTFRNLDSYYSIQKEFPNAYGINQFGLPHSTTLKRKSQAKQLKAYLLIFEQIMANFLAQLKNIPELFSLDQELKRSYFYQLLNNNNVPNSESVYCHDMSTIDEKISEIIRKYDNFEDRRIHLLDYLLAIYGEKFTQRTLRFFDNYYFTHEKLDELIRNKINFLKHIKDINKKKASAFNYLELSWNARNVTRNISGFKLKVSILLGLKDYSNKSFVYIFNKENLRLISDDSDELQELIIEDSHEHITKTFHAIPFDQSIKTLSPENIQDIFNNISLFNKKIINESFLRRGISIERYKVGHLNSARTFDVVYFSNEKKWIKIGSFYKKEKAIQLVNYLHKFLLNLNRETEGFHVIEHILLRSLYGKKHDQLYDDFYTFKISLIFPSWTARFHNKNFRSLAEETVQINCPAHILPIFHWLDFNKMNMFENMYAQWLKEKSTLEPDKQKLDYYSEEIKNFLSD